MKWYKPKYRLTGSSKHNLLAKKYRERMAEEKVKKFSKPKLTLGQKVKIKLFKVALFFVWSVERIKGVFKR